MAWFVIFLLWALWALGFVFHIAGGTIHVLLIPAVILFLVKVAVAVFPRGPSERPSIRVR